MYKICTHTLNTHSSIPGILGLFLRYIFKVKENESEANKFGERESILSKQSQAEDRLIISLNLKVINFKD